MAVRTLTTRKCFPKERHFPIPTTKLTFFSWPLEPWINTGAAKIRPQFQIMGFHVRRIHRKINGIELKDRVIL
jgi:hypothetical protein